MGEMIEYVVNEGMRWVSVNSVGCVVCREQALTEECWGRTFRERLPRLSYGG